jgi:hypothetical protein
MKLEINNCVRIRGFDMRDIKAEAPDRNWSKAWNGVLMRTGAVFNIIISSHVYTELLK